MWVRICHDLRIQKKAFKAKRENIKQAVGIQSAFMLEISSQKNIF